jgi:hypothetical protein
MTRCISLVSTCIKKVTGVDISHRERIALDTQRRMCSYGTRPRSATYPIRICRSAAFFDDEAGTSGRSSSSSNVSFRSWITSRALSDWLRRATRSSVRGGV